MNNIQLNLLQSIVTQYSIIRYLEPEIFVCNPSRLNLLKCNVDFLITMQNLENVFHKIISTRVRLGMLILILLNYCTGIAQLLTIEPELFDF